MPVGKYLGDARTFRILHRPCRTDLGQRKGDNAGQSDIQILRHRHILPLHWFSEGSTVYFRIFSNPSAAGCSLGKLLPRFCVGRIAKVCGRSSAIIVCVQTGGRLHRNVRDLTPVFCQNSWRSELLFEQNERRFLVERRGDDLKEIEEAQKSYAEATRVWKELRRTMRISTSAL